MEPSLGGVYPFCRVCTAATTNRSAPSSGTFLSIGTKFYRYGRTCDRCGSVPKFKAVCFYWIPLIPLGRYRVVNLRRTLGSATYVGRGRRRGGPAEARRLHADVVARYEAAIADHPELLDARHKEADAHWAADAPAAALPLYEQVLTEHARVLGADHPGALFLRHRVAQAHLELGQLAEAVPLLEQTARLRVRVLGAEHPDSMAALLELGWVQALLQFKKSPISVYARSATETEPGQPSGMRVRIGLAKACVEEERVDEAIRLLEGVLTECERTLGPDHPDTVLVREDLADAWVAADTSPYIPSIEEAAQSRVRHLGADHVDTLTVRNRLAYAYSVSDRVPEAITLWRSVLDGCERTSHPLTAEVERHLRETAAKMKPRRRRG